MNDSGAENKPKASGDLWHKRLKACAEQCGALLKRPGAVDTLGQLAGAIYALSKGLTHVPRKTTNHLEEIEAELTELLGALPGEGEAKEWCSGFYFNSALYRIAAAADRVAKHALSGEGCKCDPSLSQRRKFWTGAGARECDCSNEREAGKRALAKVTSAVNRLKHEPGGNSGSAEEGPGVEDALAALEWVICVALWVFSPKKAA